MRRFNWRIGLGAALAAALVACGGSEQPAAGAADTRLVVIGDSLSDSGTFYNGPGTARTFTVQGTVDEPYVLWVERLAQAYALAPLCPAYHFGGQGFTAGKAGCSNYAVGGGRINNALQPGGDGAPPSILHQLADASMAGWQDDDVLAVDGGGNDMADLVTAYLGSASDGGAAFQQLLLTLLPTETVAALLSQENGAAVAGRVYMEELANVFADAVVVDALDRGAARVVIANMPTVTFTPKFHLVLARIEQAAGPAARTQAEDLFLTWIARFNETLSQRFQGEPRVRVVDVAQRFNAFMTEPARYGLSNVTLPVCGAEGFDQVPLRAFADCTAQALSATQPPAGAPNNADWWQHFLFADEFHPTPYGHQLMADQALKVLADAGWMTR